MDSLKVNFTALNIKYQLLKECQQADHEGTQLFNTSMPSVSRGKRSLKIPDPLILDNDFKPTWKEWLGKMQIKLAVNEDHYLTEVTCIDYVLSQLGEKTAQHTESCSPYESSVTNLYCTANEILEDLKEIYKIPDKSRNYCQVYIDLIQDFKQFSEFYVKFHHLSTFLEYGKTQCMDDI